MKLSELILAHGDETVKVQNLDQSTVGLDVTFGPKGCETKIEFGTDMAVDPVSGETERLGLVLWLDRAKIAEIMKAQR